MINTDKTYLGIEFGSTRIKAVLIDGDFAPIASGSHEWENKLENGYWTYSLDGIHKGLIACFSDLKRDVNEKFGVELKTVGAMGISGMMHGYLAFDKEGNLLTPFRTWRNTTTFEAAAELTELFGFNIPQRWSIAHLYQAILNNEQHVKSIARITTLAGYIHYLLTGVHELGVGEASGMFPITNGDYDEIMIEKFDTLISQKGYNFKLRDILPTVKNAGKSNATLTSTGAKILDPTGEFDSGIQLCPPEGDAGTGMVATNSVLPKTGNVSAGTSIFSMLVLEKPLTKIHPEIDIVTTPDGSPVAMVHCNNCSSELDAWVKIFGEFSELSGNKLDKGTLYDLLYKNALNGDADCGGVCAYNYLSGEHIAGVDNGRPMYFRLPGSNMTLANFIRAQLYSTMSTLKSGMDILFDQEKAVAEKFTAHGGLFKTEGVAQQMLANALDTSVSVMETAGEGGAWGMALLAAYSKSDSDLALGEWLENNVFIGMNSKTLHPEAKGVDGFSSYIKRYKLGLEAEKKLSEVE